MTQAFYQVPKSVMKMNLTSDAKVLLVELLDKVKLSMLPQNKKNFQEKDGTPFVRMSQAKMSEFLGKSAKTVRKAIRQLIEAKLIVQKRIGLGCCNIYYVAENLIKLVFPTEREGSTQPERHPSPPINNNPKKNETIGYIGQQNKKKKQEYTRNEEKAYKDSAGQTYYIDEHGQKYCKGTGNFSSYKQRYYEPGFLNSLVSDI